jgi:hypothetical protein
MKLTGRVVPNGDCDAGQARGASAGRRQKMFGTHYYFGLRGADGKRLRAAPWMGLTPLKWRNGFSPDATFEGAFSNVIRSYAGKGIVRNVW